MNLATIESDGTTTTTHYTHSDHLSSTSVATDSTGAIIELVDYYPFGDIRFDTTSIGFSEDKKYAGHHYDEETGLSYQGARYYNPASRRFASLDPVFLTSAVPRATEEKTNINYDSYLANPQTHNSYSYTANNPIRYVDKSGEYLESAADIAFFAMSVNDFRNNPNVGNALAVVADAIGVATPFPAIVGATKATVKAAKAVDNVASTAASVSTKADGTTKNWLKYHEDPINPGGHTISKHIGKSDMYLTNRVAESNSMQAATSYSSLEAAQRDISRTISQNRPLINSWLRNTNKPRLNLQSFNGGDLGTGVTFDGYKYTNITDSFTQLIRTSDNKYKVYTGFPKLNRSKNTKIIKP